MQVGEPFSPHRAFVGIFIPDALVSFRGINAAAKLCLARLYRYCGKNKHCWPSQEELADELGVEVRSVHTYLANLSEQGFIRIEQQGMGKPNVYWMLGHPVFLDDETGNNLPVKSGSTSSDHDRQASSGPSIELKRVNRRESITTATDSPLEQEEPTQKNQTAFLDEFFRTYKRAGGKLDWRSGEKADVSDWLCGLSESWNTVMGALHVFLGDPYWHKEHWPMKAFRRHYQTYVDRFLNPPVPEAEAPEAEAVPQAAGRDFPAEWNAIVLAAPVEWDLKHSPVTELRKCMADEKFCERFEEICEIAQKAHEVQGSEAAWITFEWVVRENGKGPGWFRLLHDLRAQVTSKRGPKSKSDINMEEIKRASARVQRYHAEQRAREESA